MYSWLLVVYLTSTEPAISPHFTKRYYDPRICATIAKTYNRAYEGAVIAGCRLEFKTQGGAWKRVKEAHNDT